MLWLCFAFNKDSFCHAHALNGEKKVSHIIRAKCKFRISRWQTTTLKLVGWFLVGRLVCLFVCLCVCLFVCLFVFFCLVWFGLVWFGLVGLFFCLFVCLFVCLFACLFVCLFVCLFEIGGFLF